MQHIIDQLALAIREAAANRQPLRVRGGGTKDFYGGELQGDVLDTRAYCGIVDYEPTELVMTARCGTPLTEIESVLREGGQMLPFEPPHFGQFPSLLIPAPKGEGTFDRPSPAANVATLGGCIAAGLSGPRRPYAGAARDLVLGVRMLDGRGSDLRFGGQVMKNVAGYDVSRLVAGSLGTLGVLLEISLKVLPLPPAETTVRREHSQGEAISSMNAWAGQPLPITATCHAANQLYVRLSGAEPAVRAARAKLGGEEITDGAAFWQQVREHTHESFHGAQALWRLSLKPTTPPFDFTGAQLVEWNGALRWLAEDADPVRLRDAAARAGGHATLFRGGDKRTGVFHPQPPAMHKLHQRLKAAFDPYGILNRGRLYSDF